MVNNTFSPFYCVSSDDADDDSYDNFNSYNSYNVIFVRITRNKSLHGF